MPGPVAIQSRSLETLPRVFGRYLLLRRLSRGGMGEIFLARSGEIQGFEKLCVIKKILPNLSRNRDFTRRFVDEAKLTIQLNHQNIVPVFEVGMVAADYFLALDFVEGRDLRRILSRCFERGISVPPDLALYIARECANGLAYAHRRKDAEGKPIKLVHCDISPPNVLVSIEGEVKLIDFGVARSALQATEEDDAVGFGKFGYMAPEQIIKGRELDHRTDLYALGVVLYEMLVGDRMIDFPTDADYKEIARTVVLGQVKPPSQKRRKLGSRFDALVAKATAKEPGDRFQTAAEFRDALQREMLAVNPGISSDDLALFIRRQFDAELKQERELTGAVSEEQLEKFQRQFTDAIGNTVSYAMTDAWSVQTSAFPESAERHISRTGPALQLGPAPVERRWVIPALVVLVIVLGIGIAFVVATTGKKKKKASSRSKVVAAMGSMDAMNATSPRVRSVMRDPMPAPMPAPVPAMTPDMDVMEAPPPLLTMDAMKAMPPPMPAMRRRYRWRPMRRAAMPPPRRASSGPDKSAVMAKFRRVRARYYSFRSEYGRRLEPYWQRILKTAVYSGDDKYKLLNRQLNVLSGRMARIRKQNK